MPDQQTLCNCGYDHFGLAHDARCPECGQIAISPPPVEGKQMALGDSPSITAIVSLVLSFITLALSLLLTIGFLVMVIMLTNQGGGFGAPIGLILPVYAYISIILPAAGVTTLLAVIPTKGKHWPMALSSLVMATVSLIMPVVAFIVGILFI